MLKNCKKSKNMPYKKNFKAVLVGINYKGTSAELNGCINDVTNINKFLRTNYHPNPKNVRVLTEDQESPTEHPTKANILRELGWLVAQGVAAKRKTCLFFHYSGHGSYVYDHDGDETDRRDETICPLDYEDAGMITDDDFRKIVVEPLSKNPKVKLTVILDCCHSGTGFDLHYNYKIFGGGSQNVHSYKITQNKQYKKCACKIVMFSGCKDNQTSADAYIGGKYQGAMTHAFLKVFRDFKKSRRKLTYKKFITAVQTYLRGARYEQIPQLSSSKYVNLKGLFTLN